MARARTTNTTLWQKQTKDNDKFRAALLKDQVDEQSSAPGAHHQEADLEQFRKDSYKQALKEAKA